MKPTLYLIPCPISEDEIQTIPQYVREIIYSLSHFIAERPKTTRKYLKDIGHPKPLSELEVEGIDKHDERYHKDIVKTWLRDGKSIGVISESGCPGIADPGAELAAIAHQMGIQVKPLVGPSSILLALMGSGMNGQSFTFHGYLPRKQQELKTELRKIQKRITTEGSSHLFIETPYRNAPMFQEIINTCSAHIALCVAQDMTGTKERILSLTIKDWKTESWKPHEKLPTMFILGRLS